MQDTCTEKSRKYFISGVMGGSKKKLDSASDLVSQDYRTQISRIISSVDSDAYVVDPLETVKASAVRQGVTFEDLMSPTSDNSLVREAFEGVVALASQCDVIISNLPEASMGSAVELWEAKK